MVIKFSCGACGKKIRAKDEYAGRQTKCPTCGWGLTVPMKSEWAAPEATPVEPPPVPTGVKSVPSPEIAVPASPRQIGRRLARIAAAAILVALVAAGAEGYARWRISRLPAPARV